MNILNLKNQSIICNSDRVFSNEDGSITAFCDCNLHNSTQIKELLEKKHKFQTEGDCETPIHLYENFGLNFVEKLKGNFSIVINDRKKKRILLIRDRIGEKPLYYSFDNNKLRFASSLKSFFLHNKIETGKKMIYTFLLRGFFPRKETILPHVKKVLPGSMLIFDRGVRSIRYWNPKTTRKKESILSYKYELESLLKEIIKDFTITRNCFGIALSGGLDSAVITCIVSQLTNCKTFYMYFNENNMELLNRYYSKLVAKYFNTEHEEIFVDLDDFLKSFPITVSLMCEPVHEIDLSCIYSVMKKIDKKAKCIFTGWGADYLFSKSKDKIYTKIINVKNKLSEALCFHHKVSRYLSKEFLFPYFDHRIIEFSVNIPDELKTKNGIDKYLLRKTFQNRLPKEIIAKKSHGTGIPETWRKELINMYEDEILNSKILRKYFNVYLLKKILSSQNKNHAINLIILNTWLKSIDYEK